MSDELEPVLLAVQEMRDTISRIESRLERVERELLVRPAGVSAPVEPPATGPREIHDSEDELPPPRPAPLNSVLIGRSLIVFGGAYLLRALTESGAFPVMVGALAGLVYAAIFLFLAHRQSTTAPSSASFHATTAILIAMPLAVETSVWFREMSPWTAFLVIFLFFFASGAIGLSRRLRALVWITEFVSLGAVIVLTVGSRSFVLGLLALLTLGISSVYAARRMSSPFLMFLPALFSCLIVAPVANLAITDRAPPGAVGGLLSILTFLGAWLIAMMLDCRRDREHLGPGMTTLLTFVMALGVGGGFFVAHQTDVAFLFAPIVGLIAMATGVYAWRLTVEAGDEDRRSVTFVLVTSLLLMATTGSILGPSASAVTWLVLASLSVLIARSGHPLLFAPCFIFVLGAALESGLINWIMDALLRVPEPSTVLPGASAIATLLASVAFLVSTPRGSIRVGFLRSAVDATTTTLLVAAAAGLAIRLLQPALGAFGRGMEDPGEVAAIRTIVLSVMAIFLAWIARWPRSRTVGVLVNPILILTAVLIVVINVRVGRAATHFPAFSVYGAALIVAPALKRRSMAHRQERLKNPETESDLTPPDVVAEAIDDMRASVSAGTEK